MITEFNLKVEIELSTDQESQGNFLLMLLDSLKEDYETDSMSCSLKPSELFGFQDFELTYFVENNRNENHFSALTDTVLDFIEEHSDYWNEDSASVNVEVRVE